MSLRNRNPITSGGYGELVEEGVEKPVKRILSLLKKEGVSGKVVAFAEMSSTYGWDKDGNSRVGGSLEAGAVPSGSAQGHIGAEWESTGNGQAKSGIRVEIERPQNQEDPA